MRGTVVKLDRGFPLVRLSDATLVRCEHAKALVKNKDYRAVIGDEVEVDLPDGHDKGVIVEVAPRRTSFVRKDPAEQSRAQVLAANFDLVIVAEPLVQTNLKRLERELVLAHETGAHVAVVLTKADLASDGGEVEQARKAASDLAGHDVDVLVLAASDAESIENVRQLIPAETTAVLIGKSGVGKSSLVNLLAGSELQDTSPVRERDGKGRHTTVDRVMVRVPGGGQIVDMPGVRGLGLWDADQGISRAFRDIEELSAQCRFRDCKHADEPGCAVLAAVEGGELAQSRLDSYRSLMTELEGIRARREEARHLRGEKASDRKKRRRRNG